MFQPVRFGKYLLIDKIARGGMAEIFLAKLYGAEGFEKELVIKKILPEWSASREFLTMLIDEAKLVVLLTHANIVQIYELGREGDDHYIAMEYVDGVDLRRLWDKMGSRGKRIPTEMILYIMIEASEGLAYAHSKKNSQGENLRIIHRDVSPQNILVSFDGAVKLTDFGIAKAAMRSTETVSGVHKGKFSYMSPEQANLEELSQQSDIFSLGIVLFELLTGRRLFGGVSDVEAIDRIRRADVTFSAQDQKEIPLPLQEIVLKALTRTPKDRFRSSAAFREDLAAFARSSSQTVAREDFANFLEELFSEEIAHSPPRTTRVPVAQGEGEGTRKSLRVVGIGLSAISLILLTLFFLSRQKPDRAPPTQTTVARAIPAPAQAHPEPGTSSSTSESIGYLSAMVLPWGYISIDERKRSESPIQNLALKEGTHRVSAFYEPEGATLTTQVNLKAGSHIRCVADFEETKAIRCR